MLKLRLFALSFALLSTAFCLGQDLSSHIQVLKTSYAASGSMVVLDKHTLIIEPNMPGPVCALPKNEGGATTWSLFAFPLASITVPLDLVDDSLITEDIVFTRPDATDTYKPGDVGDTTMVVIASIPGKQFHTLSYDREKLIALGPGLHPSSAYGQAPDDVVAFGLTFAENAEARKFVDTFRKAVQLAKAETSRDRVIAGKQ